ncbi:FAD:protein FMN transferase [soil metagenome]
MTSPVTAPVFNRKLRLHEAPLTDAGEGFWEVCFFALGAECELFFSAPRREAAEDFRHEANEWLTSFEQRFSRFLPDSLISKINASAGQEWVAVDAQTEMLLDLCEHYHWISKGAFDATSLPLSRLWDWKRHHDSLPTADEITEAKKHVGWKRVQRAPGRVFLSEPGMHLDFGGLGKEFAVDCLIQLAGVCGIERIMVDLGGDLAVRGEPPEGGGWYVGLEDPLDNARCYCGIRLRHGAAVATSGDYRRRFEFEGSTYGHIIDCRTGWPVANGTRAVSVIAPHCTTAGVLSTSAMVLGGEEAIAMLQRTPGVEGCLWKNDRLYETPGFRRAVLPQGWDLE